MLETFFKWLIFRVLMGLLPIGFGYLFMVLGTKTSQDFGVLLSGGQLLLIGGTLGAGAIGELISTPKKHPIARILCGGLCLCAFVGAAGVYGWVVSSVSNGLPLDHESVIATSMGFYGVTLLAALACILIAESAKIAAANVARSAEGGRR